MAKDGVKKEIKGKPKNCKQPKFNPDWCGRYTYCIGCQKNNNKGRKLK